MRRNTAVFDRWNVEKDFACKDVAYELSTFSVFHFFSEMSSRLCQDAECA